MDDLVSKFENFHIKNKTDVNDIIDKMNKISISVKSNKHITILNILNKMNKKKHCYESKPVQIPHWIF